MELLEFCLKSLPCLRVFVSFLFPLDIGRKRSWLVGLFCDVPNTRYTVSRDIELFRNLVNGGMLKFPLVCLFNNVCRTASRSSLVKFRFDVFWGKPGMFKQKECSKLGVWRAIFQKPAVVAIIADGYRSRKLLLPVTQIQLESSQLVLRKYTLHGVLQCFVSLI